MSTILRRDMLHGTLAAGLSTITKAPSQGQPNIVIIISDQFRGDAIGALGRNPMGLTPNLDAMAKRGTLFRTAICNQPVCAPTRASIFTGQYPERHGVWKNGVALRPDATTIATALREVGYSANYIGKWHLGESKDDDATLSAGPVDAAHRGGFLNLWEAANLLEFTSHPYEGDLFDGDNQPIHFSGIYRAEFLTERARRFLERAKQPFLLVISYLEVHHQNDIDAFVPPKEYQGKYRNPFVPGDLQPLPGSWQEQLGDYFGCVRKVDDEVGKVLGLLKENGFEDNTIVAFLSDHGCHFKTRNTEYKRSPHESSIHVPLIIQGPQFNRGRQVSELVSHVDIVPTLLEAVGVPVPAVMQGRSFLPLVEQRAPTWRDEVYVTLSEFMTARVLRTPEWTYAVAEPKSEGWTPKPAAEEYFEYMLHNLAADPFQHVNLAGHAQTKAVAEELRERLAARIQEASGIRPRIRPCQYPYV